MRATILLAAALSTFVGCASADKMIAGDLAYGAPLKADFDAVNDRARYWILRNYPKGFDPDRTDELAGDYTTVWNYERSVFYRGTTRRKAHVKVEDLGGGEVRVGVAVVEQVSDNIDNPDSISEAKWQQTQLNAERALRLETQIAKRWSRFEVSKQYKEKNRDKKRTGLRTDLVEKYRDVDLEEYGEGGETPESHKPDAITGEGKKKFDEIDD